MVLLNANASNLFNAQGAINLLMAVYKKELRAMGGYLTDGSKVCSLWVNCFITRKMPFYEPSRLYQMENAKKFSLVNQSLDGTKQITLVLGIMILFYLPHHRNTFET